MDEVLRSALLRLPAARSASGGNEVVVRCPYCGDSANKHHAHFYIGEKETNVYGYDCKKCPASGILSAAVLTDLQVYDISALEFIKSVFPKNKTIRINGNKDDKIHFNILTSLDDSQHKIDYLSERTKMDFSLAENIKSHKIIYRLEDFVRANNLIPQQNPEIMRDLNDNYVGFLSQNKSTILLRNVSSTKTDSRYHQYRIDPNRKAPFIYIPPCAIDPLTPRPRIVLAEGPFDIICIKNQFFPSDDTSTIFGASGSRGSYKSAFVHLLRLSGYFGADVSIFNDVDNRKRGYEPIILELKEKVFKPFLTSFEFTALFNNDEEHKDFGYIADNWDIKRFSLAS